MSRTFCIAMMDAIGAMNMDVGMMKWHIRTMSKQTVYQGLKTAVIRNAFSHHGFQDDEATILFESWDQFKPFDKFLDTVPLPRNMKLCIYAEDVNSHPDGVAVTVSDDIQHLTYWDLYSNMEEKVSIWENILSQALRAGVKFVDYDYETFTVEFDKFEFYKIKREFVKDKEKYLPNDVKYYISEHEISVAKTYILHMEFAD